MSGEERVRDEPPMGGAPDRGCGSPARARHHGDDDRGGGDRPRDFMPVHHDRAYANTQGRRTSS